MMKQPSYKTRGMSNGVIQANQSKNKDEGSTQTVIFGVIGVGLLLIILLYLTFGGSSIRGASIVVGQERISQLSDDKRSIPVHDKTIQVMGQKIFYRECNPIDTQYQTVDVLFLHGKKYSSSTWKGLGTLQIFASYGYRAVAVDLPGYGLSKKSIPYTNDLERTRFIENFVNAIDLRHVVIVAPSMGGDFAIPVLIENSHNDLDFELNGLVAVAPTRTEKYDKTDYQKVKTPVLIMWGERDRTDLAKNANFFLPNIPNSEQMMVPKAQHAAFVGNPGSFHTFILKYLQDKCKLRKDDYEEDYDFGDFDWDASDSATYDYDYELGDMFDDYTSGMTYDYDDDNMFDDMFSSDTSTYDDDQYSTGSNTNGNTYDSDTSDTDGSFGTFDDNYDQ